MSATLIPTTPAWTGLEPNVYNARSSDTNNTGLLRWATDSEMFGSDTCSWRYNIRDLTARGCDETLISSHTTRLSPTLRPRTSFWNWIVACALLSHKGLEPAFPGPYIGDIVFKAFSILPRSRTIWAAPKLYLWLTLEKTWFNRKRIGGGTFKQKGTRPPHV